MRSSAGSSGGEVGADARFRAAFEGVCRGVFAPGSTVVVALSGGMDSTALLHLLRFPPSGGAGSGIEVHGAHFDHGMRPGSGEDARWVRGLCHAWGLPLHSGGPPSVPPRNEAEARRVRYAFLREVQHRLRATHLLTGHHADDQAETVLFRALRGSGPQGLAGIPTHGPEGLFRPLLGFRREEIARWARRQGIRYRDDPSNRDPRFTRNRIRGELLPLAEAIVPGAVGSLAGLARRMREREAGWDELLGRLDAEIVETERPGEIVALHAPFRSLGPAVTRALLTRWARRLGAELSPGSARTLDAFMRNAPSGRSIGLAGGLSAVREFDRIRLWGGDSGSRSAEVPGPGLPEFLLDPDLSNEGAVHLPSGRLRWSFEAIPAGGSAEAPAQWAPGAPHEGPGGERFFVQRLHFPLRIRTLHPGDRIRLRGGSRLVRRLLIDRRVPESRRRGVPLLVDAAGRVLWVAGIARAHPEAGEGPGFHLHLRFEHVDHE